MEESRKNAKGKTKKIAITLMILILVFWVVANVINIANRKKELEESYDEYYSTYMQHQEQGYCKLKVDSEKGAIKQYNCAVCDIFKYKKYASKEEYVESVMERTKSYEFEKFEYAAVGIGVIAFAWGGIYLYHRKKEETSS